MAETLSPAGANSGAEGSSVSSGYDANIAQASGFQADAYDNVPDELKARRQWVVWRVEHVNGKLTKVPYTPNTTRHARTDDPSTFRSFDECVATVRAGQWDGVGFVFTRDDPYCFIDLDAPKDANGHHYQDPQLWERQNELYKLADSYSETSPSGHGLHIIVRGALPEGKGRKRDHIEIYSEGRFATFTGKVVNAGPIQPQQELCERVWHSLISDSATTDADVDMSRPATADDQVIYERASHAANGDKFIRLWNGDVTDYGGDTSSADMALCELLAFYTPSADQIQRMWLASPLGNRDKTRRRKAYRQETIRKALARVESRRPPPVDSSGLQRQFEAMVSSPSQVSQASQVAIVGGFSNLEGVGQFIGNSPPPRYVWQRVLQAGSLYALTAPWGAGKTAIAITIALHVATGRQLAGRKTAKSRVLFLCGENPDDVKLRVRAAAALFNIDPSELEGAVYFTRGAFSIDDKHSHERFVADASRYGAFDLMIVDTGPAHSKAEDENDNRQMQLMAEATRFLMSQLGNPSTVVLMHPAKSATRESLQPRGGGAFSGSIDGELCAWKDGVLVEFFHRSKFRGPGFDPMFFTLERYTFHNIVDNFGEPSISVVAMPTSEKPARKLVITGANRIALDALKASMTDAIPPSDAILQEQTAFAPRVVVPEALWRERCYATGIAEGEQDAKRRAFTRCRKALIEMGLVRTFADNYWLNEWCEPRATPNTSIV